MNKQQEPRLRFKGFTGAWEEKVLGENASFTKGSGYSKSDLTDSGFPIILYGRLYTKYENIIENVDTFVSCDKNALKSLGNEVIVPASGETAEDIARASAVYQQDVILGGDLNIITPNENIASPFLALTLTNGKSNQELAKKAQGKSVVHLRNDDLRACKISFPSFLEQTHLGLFFRRLDNQIAESRAVLKKSRQLKKAMLAKMFPANGEKIPKIRFKGFEGEWREWKLGAFGKATSGTSLESEFCEDGNYKVISIGSYSEKSTYTDQGIRTHKNDKTEKRILNKNDLTMILNDKTSSGRIIGRVLLIDQNDTYVYNQRTQRIEIDQEHFIPLFLYHLLNAENMRQKIIYSAQGNTQIYVNWSGIKNLEYLIPPTKAEQAAIGNFFRQLDETIALQSAEVEKLNQIKKGLLAAMLV